MNLSWEISNDDDRGSQKSEAFFAREGLLHPVERRTVINFLRIITKNDLIRDKEEGVASFLPVDLLVRKIQMEVASSHFQTDARLRQKNVLLQKGF